jgi:hypothetical protein
MTQVAELASKLKALCSIPKTTTTTKAGKKEMMDTLGIRWGKAEWRGEGMTVP